VSQVGHFWHRDIGRFERFISVFHVRASNCS